MTHLGHPSAWITPRTWVVGEMVAASKLNQELQDNLLFLNKGIAALVYKTGDQTISNNASEQVNFNAEYLDTDNMHDLNANTGRLTVNTPGQYKVGCHFRFTANSTGSRRANIFFHDLGGSSSEIGRGQHRASSATDAASAWAMTQWDDVQIGEYFTFEAFQNSGGGLSIAASGIWAIQAWAMRVSG